MRCLLRNFNILLLLSAMHCFCSVDILDSTSIQHALVDNRWFWVLLHRMPPAVIFQDLMPPVQHYLVVALASANHVIIATSNKFQFIFVMDHFLNIELFFGRTSMCCFFINFALGVFPVSQLCGPTVSQCSRTLSIVLL